MSVTTMAPVDLEELNAVAALQARHDRKYILSIDEAREFLSELAPSARVLEIDGTQAFRYESVYFDTPDLSSYLAAARGRPRRHKVRTRTYLDSDTCALEVKVKDPRGNTVKHRLTHPLEHRRHLTEEGRAFITGVRGHDPAPESLGPTLTTRYVRSTFLITASSSRVTIDTGLRCSRPDGTQITRPGLALIETKSEHGPTLVDRLLWSRHHRPVKLSKYCLGMAALTPGLPANKWSRVLQRHFDWSPRPAPGEAVTPESRWRPPEDAPASPIGAR